MRYCPNCNRLVGASIASCPDGHGETTPIEEDEPPPGAIVGKYKLIRPLGEGGMGYVYEGVHTVLGRRAAIKFLRSEYLRLAEIVARFLQEAQAVNRIDHDGIIDVYDYGDGSDGIVYFVMEFLEGQTLREYQQQNHPVPAGVLLPIYRQILSALVAAHEQQIVHRDLKPDNIFLINRADNPRFVKVLDFGVAKVTGEGATPNLTNVGTVLGTPEYMSPEQIAGRVSDARSDIYSVGAMLYDAVVGNVPFRAEGFGALATQVLTAPLTPPSVAAPEISIDPRLERVIVRALEKDREDRYQTMAEMLAEFDAIELEGNAAQAAEMIPSATPSRNVVAKSVVRTHRRSGLILAGAAVVAIAVGLVLAVGNSSTDDDSSAHQPGSIDAASAKVSSFVELVRAGDTIAVRTRAHIALEAALAHVDANVANQSAAGMAISSSGAVATLLFDELESGPQRRSRAARALAEIGLPEATSKLRASLAKSGDRLRVEIASAMVTLGDRDGVAILKRALEGDRMSALIAAETLARQQIGSAGSDYLRTVITQSQPGRPRWIRAAAILAQQGDQELAKAARAELTGGDLNRSTSAAIALAREGDEQALAYLERMIVDKDASDLGNVALALARSDNSSALEFVDRGLRSAQASERVLACAVVSRLAKSATRFTAQVAALADEDDDTRVRAAALAALIAL